MPARGAPAAAAARVWGRGGARSRNGGPLPSPSAPGAGGLAPQPLVGCAAGLGLFRFTFPSSPSSGDARRRVWCSLPAPAAALPASLGSSHCQAALLLGALPRHGTAPACLVLGFPPRAPALTPLLTAACEANVLCSTSLRQLRVSEPAAQMPSTSSAVPRCPGRAWQGGNRKEIADPVVSQIIA